MKVGDNTFTVIMTIIGAILGFVVAYYSVRKHDSLMATQVQSIAAAIVVAFIFYGMSKEDKQ